MTNYQKVIPLNQNAKQILAKMQSKFQLLKKYFFKFIFLYRRDDVSK